VLAAALRNGQRDDMYAQLTRILGPFAAILVDTSIGPREQS